MSGMRYSDIGHSPSVGPVVLWSIDENGRFREDGRLWSDEFDPGPPPALNDPRTVKAFGRVEVNRDAGSVCVMGSPERFGQEHLLQLLDALNAQFPGKRWYVFGTDGENIKNDAA